MKEYHKIETVFERDMQGTKKLIEGKYRDPMVEYLKDNEWIFTEKVDGTNIRIHWDGHKVVIGGRTEAAQIPSHLLGFLTEKFLGETNAQMFEQQFGVTPVTLYGEGYGAKIQSGGAYSPEAKFILFDVEINEYFLLRADIESIAQSFGIQTVPIVFTGKIDEAITRVKLKPQSMLTSVPKEIEGLIGVPKVPVYDRRGNRVIIKIKVVDFNSLEK